jgi:hypothetical protein
MDSRVRMGGAALLVLLLAAAGPALANDDTIDGGRRWALGWEGGLTVRHAFGPWDLSLTAGPDDLDADSERTTWDSTLPDSLQADPGRTTDYERDGRIVRLAAGRELTRHRTLSLHGTFGVMRRWVDVTNRSEDYYPDRTPRYWGVSTSEYDTWGFDLGLRMAWRPAPIVSIQVRAGLVLELEDRAAVVETHYVDSGRVTRSRESSEETSLSDYGPTGTGSIEFFFWF